MFHRFCHAQNLRALLKHASIPEILHPFIDIFIKFFAHPVKGAGSIDDLPYDESYRPGEEEALKIDHLQTRLLTPADRILLAAWIHDNDADCEPKSISSHVHSRKTVRRLGQSFSIREVSVRDSNISYLSISEGHWAAASIIQMFSHTRERKNGSKKTETFVVINNYAPSSPELERPYLRYPQIGIRVFDTDLQPERVLLSVDQVLSHVSCCRLSFGEDGSEGDCLVSVQLSHI